MTRRALITGITGQDGSYLADILLERGYEVHGLIRHSSADNLCRLRHCLDKLTLHRGDVLDSVSLEMALLCSEPDEIYHEADQDSVAWSYDAPLYSHAVTAGSVQTLLELVRQFRPKAKVFLPVSATMFGDAPAPQNELTPFNPSSPYAVAKVAAYHAARYYRQAHGLFVSTGILFNHDSPRRADGYLLQKICRGAVRIYYGLQKTLPLGNLDLRVDVGYAREYMEAAHAILQLDQPNDFVLATGEGWTLRQMVKEAFSLAGVDDPAHYLTTDSRFYRPGPQPTLIGDASKARQVFGFNPQWSIGRLMAYLIGELRRGGANGPG